MKKFSYYFFQSGSGFVTLLMLVAFWVGSCHPKLAVEMDKKKWVEANTTDEKKTAGENQESTGFVSFRTDTTEPGLMFTLRESTHQKSVSNSPVQSGTFLDAKLVNELLARAKETTTKTAIKKKFALRKATTPPPRTGETFDMEFQKMSVTPPDATPGKPYVTVERFGPAGELELAAHVSITFSKPMVTVTDVKSMAKNAVVPATISPMPPGEWRWLGTKTLLFKPQKRMPMATHFVVSIPKDTKSADGTPIKEAMTFSFDTPPLQMKQQYPIGGPHKLDVKIGVEFDQPVDSVVLFPFIKITSNGTPISSRLATENETAEFDRQYAHLSNKKKNRIVLVPERLPKASTIEVRVTKGAPSLEGPKRTTRVQQFDFYTYRPFKVTQSRCGYSGQCRQNESFDIEFNNDIDSGVFKDAMVTVEPPIDDMEIGVSGNYLRIHGSKQGKTNYKVTIGKEITDEFGQRLRKKKTASFFTTRLEPTLIGPNEGMVTLSPYEKPEVAIHSINYRQLKMTVHRVDESHFYKWAKWRHDLLRNEKRDVPMPGAPLVQRVLKPTVNDKWQRSNIDFSNWLKKGVGHFAVMVEPLPMTQTPWNRQEIMLWVQVTKIGVSAFKENRSLLAWATTLKEGMPIAGARFTLWPQKNITTKSDGTGLGALRLPADGGKFLVVKNGSDAAIIYPGTLDSMIWGGGTWRETIPRNRLSCYATSDRGIYKPGETVNLKGWIRKINSEKAATLSEDVRPVKKVRWRLLGPRRNELGSGEVKTTPLGGFHFRVKLPKNCNLGAGEIELFSDQTDLDFPYQHKFHRIQIQEFKKPEFEVTTSVSEDPHLLGETAEASIFAKYYTGESLLGAPVQWHVSASQGNYTPPNHNDFSFGTYRPSWRFWAMPSWNSPAQSFEGKTGVGGEHKLEIHFESLMSKEPTNVTFSGTVTDVNRQQWTSSTTTLVHPSARYIGVKLEENFVKANTTAALDVVVTDIGGNRTAGEKVVVNFYRLDSKWKDGMRTDTDVAAGTCTFTAKGAVHRCDFVPQKAGKYKWVATTKDAAGRPAHSTMSIWVTGSGAPKIQHLDQEKVRIIPKTDKCKPGKNTSVLIQTPFYPAQGLVTLRKEGIRYKKRIAFDGPSKTVTVPITEMEIPSVTLQVDVTGVSKKDSKQGSPAGEVRTPAFASGNIVLEVSPYKKRFDVIVTPKQRELAPGASSSILVKVTDSAGRTKENAEVALWVVDEAVLALTKYKVADPVELFYAKAGEGVMDTHSRSSILKPQTSEDLFQFISDRTIVQKRMKVLGYADGDVERFPHAEAVAMPAPMKMKRATKSGGAGGNRAEAIMVRSVFDALAFYEPSLKTDKNGEISVAFQLPDSLTRYRVMAVVADDRNRFGNGESTLVARLPLMVRPSAPRFLNFGDKFEFPVVIQNRSTKAQEVNVAVQADNVVFGDSMASLTPGKGGKKQVGKTIMVPAKDRVEVRFPATTQSAGTAHFKVVAASRSSSDSAMADLPVWTPATTEAFATYGSVEAENVFQSVQAPKDVWTQFGGVTVTTSSTGLQALTDAFIYLVDYPYSCSEQLASKILAIATLKDVLFAFNAKELPSKSKLEKAVNEALRKLAGRQQWNGEFGLWYKGGRSWPYANVHIANALAVAKQKKFAVDENMLQRSINYLNNIEHHIPAWYSESSKNSLRGYALNVLHKIGFENEDQAKALILKVGTKKLSFEAKGWLLPVVQKNEELRKKLLRDADNHVAQTAKNAHFVTHYSDGAYVLMHSDRRVDGIWLEALIEVDKSNPLIPKLMSGLLAHRKNGRWQSTQENCFVLSALDKYFHAFEQVTPDFVSRVWLGDMVSDKHRFSGRTTESARVNVAMTHVPQKKSNLVIEKTGKGRMYFRIGMNYAPKNLNLDPADYGFVVQRNYRGVESDEDVWKDKKGVWHVKSGARVRVELTMVATAPRYHVVLEDPLPAGFEAVNPALAVEENSASTNTSNQRNYWWWYRPWFEHQNLRDEKVEAFTSLLWDGVYTYSYEAKATTPGEFIVPPAKAMEMYEPETFGRTSTDHVIVE